MDTEKEFAFPKAIAQILDTVETRAAWSIFNDQKTPEEKAKDEELRKRRKFKPYSPESEIKKICEELRSKGAEKEAEHLENEYQARLKRGTDFGIANKSNFEYFLTDEGHESYTPYGARSIVLDSKTKAVDTENQTATTISSTISDNNSITPEQSAQYDYSNLPKELTCKKNFVLWKYETVDGRLTKVPYNVYNGKKSKANTPETWAPFQLAVDTYKTVLVMHLTALALSV